MARKSGKNGKHAFSSLAALNELLALSLRTDQERAGHIRHAVSFLALEAEENLGVSRGMADLGLVARRLVALHAGEGRAVGFAHCDLGATHADPLFLRPQLLAAVRELVGYREGLLLVTGLRQAVTAGRDYFSASRRNNYRQTQALIEALVARLCPPRTRLHMVFV